MTTIISKPLAALSALVALISSATPADAAGTAHLANGNTVITSTPSSYSGPYTINLKTLSGIPLTVTLRGIIRPSRHIT